MSTPGAYARFSRPRACSPWIRGHRMPAHTAPLFSIRTVELFERPVVLRLPFRFGVVTLTACPQAFVRATIAFADGRTQAGVAAEMMAPKWFDKNLALSNEDNFDQLRSVLLLGRETYLGDASPATAFGHFARHYDAHLATAGARGFNPLLANYGPALIDRAIVDAVCRASNIDFYTAMRDNLGYLARRGKSRKREPVPVAARPSRRSCPGAARIRRWHIWPDHWSASYRRPAGRDRTAGPTPWQARYSAAPPWPSPPDRPAARCRRQGRHRLHEFPRAGAKSRRPS